MALYLLDLSLLEEKTKNFSENQIAASVVFLIRLANK
jgi:hypothetical protein